MREFLLRAMRKEGVTSHEVIDIIPQTSVNKAIITLRDQKGWDIRGFPCPKERFPETATRKHPLIYKVVGKMRWDGSYRSFTHDLAKEELSQ